jgi:hypothetical protein
MASFEITVTGMDKIENMLKQYPAICERNVNKAIKASLLAMKQIAYRLVPHGATKNLAQQWEIKTDRFEGTLEAKAKYAHDVEFGSSPHYVDPTDLLEWARFKGIDPLRVFVIAAAISKYGTKPHPFMDAIMAEGKPKVDTFLAQSIGQTVKEMAQT